MSQQTMPDRLRRAIEQHQLAVNQFVNGNARLWKQLCSKKERSKVQLGARDGIVPMASRVTSVYRGEAQEWKMVNRHADNLVPIQATEIARS
jgi:hypothetical protein